MKLTVSGIPRLDERRNQRAKCQCDAHEKWAQRWSKNFALSWVEPDAESREDQSLCEEELEDEDLAAGDERGVDCAAGYGALPS